MTLPLPLGTSEDLIENKGMCSRYKPLLVEASLKEHFGVDGIEPSSPDELYPGYLGPFIRKHQYAEVGDEAVPFKELMMGFFGLIPHWAKDTKIVRHTNNSRSETDHEKPKIGRAS